MRKRDVKEAVEKRKMLEKKHTSLAITFGCGSELKRLPQNRISSVSPNAYYYISGINTNGYDMRENKKLNKLIHSDLSKRGQIEAKIFKILVMRDGSKPYYHAFTLKDYLFKVDFEGVNDWLSRNYFKKINKNKYRELQNLFGKFEELSKYEHYHVNGVHKRLVKKARRQND